jgi:hypothetical protein
MPTKSTKNLKKSLRDYEAAADKRVLKVDELKSAAKLIEVAEDKGLDKEVSALRKQLQSQPKNELIVAGPTKDLTPIRLPGPGKKVNDLGMGVTEIVPKVAKQPERTPKPRPPVKNELIVVGPGQDRTPIRMPPPGKREIDIGMGKREIVPTNLKRPGGVEGIPKIKRSAVEEAPLPKAATAVAEKAPAAVAEKQAAKSALKSTKPAGLFTKLARAGSTPAGKVAAGTLGLLAGAGAYLGSQGEAADEKPMTKKEADKTEAYLGAVAEGTSATGTSETGGGGGNVEIPRPKELSALLKDLSKVSTEMNPEDKEAFTSRLQELDSRLVEADSRYEQAKSRAEWAEVAEIVGQAAIQLMAGMEASKYKQSAAGIAAPRINWDSRFDRLLQEYDSRKDTIDKQRSGVEREMERAEGKAEREASFVKGILSRDYFENVTRYGQAAREAAKEARAKGEDTVKLQRQADEKAKRIIGNYEMAGNSLRQLEEGGFTPKERAALEQQLVKELSEAGNIGAANALQENVKKANWFWEKDNYTQLRNYIELNKKSSIINHYKGYELPVPKEINDALNGVTTEAATKPKKKAITADELPDL